MPEQSPQSHAPSCAANVADLGALYQRSIRAVQGGRYAEAQELYDQLARRATEPQLRALVLNDQASLAVVNNDWSAAEKGFRSALAIDASCQSARLNLAFVEAQRPRSVAASTRIAVLSFLFNWPSKGGGIIHTIELAKFLVRAGYDVQHFYARYPGWALGVVDNLTLPGHAIDFTDTSWNIHTIQSLFREAVDKFNPDYVLVTDCWNFKPHLARAMRGYPTLLRFQAMECLCPLNNVRLLSDAPNRFTQCPRHQLATPKQCHRCLVEHGHQSGGLHQADRAFAGVGTPEYDQALREALQDAEAVLVLNPLVEAMISPYARYVAVVPWGMDPARFPQPVAQNEDREHRPLRVFQAGLPDEPMKGFAILHTACARLWNKRHDFELVVTGDPAGRIDAFTHFTGWVSQEDLPDHYRAADIVVVPTVAQEGLSRTSVEAMACGKPVVASRIGGLPFTVTDGATGLLTVPGDPADLAAKIGTLLDDPTLRRRLGTAGRKRFEEEYAWPTVIERYYRPLFHSPKHLRR